MYQGVLEHAISKVDYSIDTGIYMLPSNLTLIMEKTEGYKTEFSSSNIDMRY